METSEFITVSEEQESAIIMKWQAEQREKREKNIQARKALVDLEDEAMNEMFEEAERISGEMAMFKHKWIERMETLRIMKIDCEKASPNQESYSYTTKDGKKKAIIAQNMSDRYDDGINAGIDYAKEWMSKQIVDEKSKMLINIIEGLMSRDKQGSYSSNNLMSFIKHAKENNDPLLEKAADCILNSIRKEATTISIRIWSVDDKGVKRYIPLSATKS